MTLDHLATAERVAAAAQFQARGKALKPRAVLVLDAHGVVKAAAADSTPPDRRPAARSQARPRLI